MQAAAVFKANYIAGVIQEILTDIVSVARITARIEIFFLLFFRFVAEAGYSVDVRRQVFLIFFVFECLGRPFGGKGHLAHLGHALALDNACALGPLVLAFDFGDCLKWRPVTFENPASRRLLVCDEVVVELNHPRDCFFID